MNGVKREFHGVVDDSMIKWSNEAGVGRLMIVVDNAFIVATAVGRGVRLIAIG